MTTPEESRRKTPKTDDVLGDPDTHQKDEQQTPGATSRTLAEAMDEANITPDDYDQEPGDDQPSRP
ncbi:hypothetical protein OYE22_19240 [Streptomyces sp. 71268]|uniref:hypothetical protein n=1 Tax=Streptomyces sp. 71268 TaxID=3002640 RepID=UPI0023F8B124|nr:hypothetical protein [Streptomyces sp. 71268]WEV27093.1 hypothetical protein OYE22_19240 [Streptomyces sp. 71268]